LGANGSPLPHSLVIDSVRTPDQSRFVKIPEFYANHKGDKVNNLKKKFASFLIKARNRKELERVFGNETDNLLQAKHEGLVLFTQRNQYNEIVYILLPKPPKGIRLLPKRYEYHIGKDERGNEQPYLLVKIPNFKGKVVVAPLFDIHYGHKTHNFEKFMGYIRWIRETPNVYAILGGDVMENALDDGRGMSYDQEHPPMAQLDRMTEILSTISHKILASTPGN